jgi:hypothetical protein
MYCDSLALVVAAMAVASFATARGCRQLELPLQAKLQRCAIRTKLIDGRSIVQQQLPGLGQLRLQLLGILPGLGRKQGGRVDHKLSLSGASARDWAAQV